MGTLTAGLLVADAVLLVGRAGALYFQTVRQDAARGWFDFALRLLFNLFHRFRFRFWLGFWLRLGFSITTGASLGGSRIGSGSGSGSTGSGVRLNRTGAARVSRVKPLSP